MPAKKYVALNPAVLPLTPSRGALRRFDFILKAVGWIGRFALRCYVKKIEVVGLEHLSGGSKFILMNHSSPLDPILLTLYARKSFQFLITEPFMADRKISRFVAWMGQIPKRKLDPDTRAIRMMKLWCKNGGNIATFPEGQFSWDGYPLPLQPGLSELIKYLEVPVVIVRLTNGDRLWPAWATHPRRTSLRLEIEPPKYFEPGESIDEYVAQHLFVDPDTCTRFPVSGKNFAEGISRFLRYCFYCGADGTLSDVGNELHCSHCKLTWEVNGDNQLQLKGNHSSSITVANTVSITVANAWKQVRAHLLKKWGSSVPFCKSQAVVMVMDASRTQWVPITEDTLELRDSSLYVGSWQMNLKDILSHTMDWGDLILLRSERQRIAIRMPNDSRAVWTFVLEEALKKEAAHAI